MARDMYGNDANFNGYLASRPDGAFMPPQQRPLLLHHAASPVTPDRHAVQPDDQHPRRRPDVLRLQLHPLDAAGLVQRHAAQSLAQAVIAQTLEVLADSGYNPGATGYRTFTVNIGSPRASARRSDSCRPAICRRPCSTPAAGLRHPACRASTSSHAATDTHEPGHTAPFILDGRWLHAFNGPGMTTNAVHANFRYNGI